MQAYVIVATKGRAPETGRLVVDLAMQTRPADAIVIVGTEVADFAGIDVDTSANGRVITLVADRPSAAGQRNLGIEHIFATIGVEVAAESVFAFFDDDFRPAPDWLKNAIAAFEYRLDALALGGELLLNEPGTSEDHASALIAEDVKRREGRAGGEVQYVGGLYGCNMAVRGTFLRDARFDGGLPLYSWLEDADLSIRIKRKGKIVQASGCRGVHLNTIRGRTSGLRFGYSQIANPIYLTRKGVMPLLVTFKLVFQALIANLYHRVLPRPDVDHPGRLNGNVRALRDVVLRRDRPDRIIDLVG